MFWLALSAGVAVSASGYLLLFPFYATSIIGMQIANVIHSVGAILFIALILGHIYIGTIGMEGAFEAMWTGEVDFNWAKEHHNLCSRRSSPRAKASTMLRTCLRARRSEGQSSTRVAVAATGA